MKLRADEGLFKRKQYVETECYVCGDNIWVRLTYPWQDAACKEHKREMQRRIVAIIGRVG